MLTDHTLHPGISAGLLGLQYILALVAYGDIVIKYSCVELERLINGLVDLRKINWQQF